MTYTPPEVDRYSGVPLWRQIADALRYSIESGHLAPGATLPSEQAMADLLGVTRDVVRKGLSSVQADGLIVRRSGAMTRVAEPPSRRRMSASRYSEAIQKLEAEGKHPESSAFTADHGVTWENYKPEFKVSQEPANERDAEWLDLPVGELVLRRRFVKYGSEGEPVQLQRSAMPWSIAGGTAVADPDRQPWPGGTLAELWFLGWRVSRVVEETTARMPRDNDRRLLQMSVPGPVLDIVRIFYAVPLEGKGDERPVEASRVIAPAASNVLRYETQV